MGPGERTSTLETFTSVTSCDAGTSRAILEHYKWDLDRAVDAFFDGSWQNALVDASEAAALAATGASPPSPPFPTTGGVQCLVDSDDDDDQFGGPAPGRQFNEDADYEYVDDEDGDDAMLASAVDEGAASRGMRPPPPRTGTGTGHVFAPIMIDDEDEELQRAIDASMGGAAGGGGPGSRRPPDHERDNRPPPSPAQDLNFGGSFAPGGGGAGFGGGRGIGGQGGGAVGGFGGAQNAQGSGRVDDDLPEGVTRAELEEARMLEAAMLGVPYEGHVPDGSGLGVSGFGIGAENGAPPPSAAVQEARIIRGDTDWAYQESLRMDKEKETKRVKEELAARKAKQEAAEKEAKEAREAADAAAERDAYIAQANDALPDEPAPGAPNTVDVAVKLPGGNRVRRLFNASDKLSAIFNFLVSHEHLELGTFRLVSQFPRRSFENNTEGNPTLTQAGLTEKQEALFVDLL